MTVLLVICSEKLGKQSYQNMMEFFFIARSFKSFFIHAMKEKTFTYF